MNYKALFGGALAASLLATTAIAQTSATASADLNLRAGPGPMHDIIGVISAGNSVEVAGCLDDANWCEVTLDGTQGWAYGAYLETEIEAKPVALTAPEARTRVTVVEHQGDTETNVVAGGTAGAVIGAVIAGPFGAAVGAVIGMGAGGAATPSETTVTYVRENPVDQVYLDGEVVVGSGLPEGVTLQPVPESEYHYAYVNGVPVIVESTERRVVHIVR